MSLEALRNSPLFCRILRVGYRVIRITLFPVFCLLNTIALNLNNCFKTSQTNSIECVIDLNKFKINKTSKLKKKVNKISTMIFRNDPVNSSGKGTSEIAGNVL